MTSVNFPQIFNAANTNIKSDKEAIKQNLLLLLSSEKGSFFGDPQYGCSFKRYIFEQGSNIIPDILIDDIYSAIVTYIPQVYTTRKQIKPFIDHTSLYVSIEYSYRLDNTSDMFTIQLNSSADID